MRTKSSISTARLLQGRPCGIRPRCIDQRLGDLLADGHHRIERGHRLLEDHRDVVARARARISSSLKLQEIDGHPSLTEPADDTARRVGDQPHQRQRRHALAAARFAHDGQRLAARRRRTATPSTAFADALARVEVGFQVGDGEQWVGDFDAGDCAGSCRLGLAVVRNDRHRLQGLRLGHERDFPRTALKSAAADPTDRATHRQVGLREHHHETDGEAGDRSPATAPYARIRRPIPTACGPRTDAARECRGQGRRARPRPGWPSRAVPSPARSAAPAYWAGYGARRCAGLAHADGPRRLDERQLASSESVLERTTRATVGTSGMAMAMMVFRSDGPSEAAMMMAQ